VGSAHVPENPERVYRRGLPASPVRAFKEMLYQKKNECFSTLINPVRGPKPPLQTILAQDFLDHTFF
jgi:hypothetical protein